MVININLEIYDTKQLENVMKTSAVDVMDVFREHKSPDRYLEIAMKILSLVLLEWQWCYIPYCESECAVIDRSIQKE